MRGGSVGGENGPEIHEKGRKNRWVSKDEEEWTNLGAKSKEKWWRG